MGGTIHLLLISVLTLWGAACVTALLGFRSKAAHLLALYVVAYAELVLVLETAGLFNAIRAPVVAAVQVVLTAGCVLVWLAQGRPSILGPFADFRLESPRWDWRSASKASALVVMAGVVGYMYALRAGVILATHPSNYDSLTYHLSRVGYWLQYQSFYPWPTPNLRQTTFPMNAELGVLWTVLWWGSDRLSGLVQWTTVPVIMLGIYGLSRLLGYSRWPSAMGALLWATLPQTLHQSSTTQNDLVTAAFWVSAVYFLYLGIRGRKPIPVYLSGLCLGLAMGTKSTSLIALPGLGLMVLAILWAMRWRRWAWQLLGRWAVASAVGVLLFGSYVYIQNIVAFGNPLGASSARSGPQALVAARGVRTFTDRLRDNLGRYTYQLVDFSGLPAPIPEALNAGKAAVFARIFRSLGVPYENPDTIALSTFDLGFINRLNENESWFGPVGILLMAALCLQAVRGVRGGDAVRVGLIVMFVTFLIVQSALQQWTPFKGRYYLLPVSVSFALVCMLLVPSSAWRTVLAGAVLALGCVVMAYVTQDAQMLSGIGWRGVLAAERSAPSPPSSFGLALIDALVPENASVGLEGGVDYTDYPFFGEYFKRHITLAVPEEKELLPRVDVGRYETDFWNSDYIYLQSGPDSALHRRAAQGFAPLIDDAVESLWIREDLRPDDECDGARWPLTDLVQVSARAACPRFPLYVWEYGIGYRDGAFEPSIGPGPAGRFGFDLLVREPSTIRISLRLKPTGVDLDHTLRLDVFDPGSEPRRLESAFQMGEPVEFPLALEPGEYQLEFSLTQGAQEARILSISIEDR